MSDYKTTLNAESKKLLRTRAGLEPFIPSSGKNWDSRLAGHLLRRATFGPTLDMMKESEELGLEASVDKLLRGKDLPSPPGTWVGDQPFSSPDKEERRIRRQRMEDLRDWWIGLMVEEDFSIWEKMTFFWHGHFTTEAKAVVIPQRMYRQNDFLRVNALDNFRKLAINLTTDPAMLVYLDGWSNRVGSPNENYARELLELFTLGEGSGYTQKDIEEAARALTGWIIDGLIGKFSERRFDPGEKEFMGRTGNLGYVDIILTIFEQPRTAEFICEKLYSYFVYHDPDPDIVKEMANTLRAHSFEIRPVLRQLLLSQHFYDDSLIGSKIKSPLEFAIGTFRGLYLSEPDLSYLTEFTKTLGQHVFDPPNVAGWPGHHSWISTVTLPLRQIFTDALMDGKTIDGELLDSRPVPLDIARRMSEPDNAVQLIDDFADCYLSVPLSARNKEFLLATLLEGAEVYDFALSAPQADTRIRRTLKALMRLPEYQLT